MDRSWRFAAWFALVWIVVAFVPWAPPFRPDFAEQQLHWGFVRHWQFGRDIVFNAGPLGFLGIPLYDPATHGWVILTHLAVIALAVLFFHEFARRFIESSAGVWLHAAIVLLPLCLSPVFYWSPLLALPFILIIGLAILHFFAEDRLSEAIRLPLLGVLGLAVWIKASLVAAVLLGVLCIEIDEFWRKRRVPYGLLVFFVSAAAGWLLGRQSGFGNIGICLSYTKEFVDGYRKVMPLWSAASTEYGFLVLLCVLLVAALLFLAGWPRLHWRIAGPLLVWGIVGASLFSHGFIRADGGHMTNAILTLLSCVILIIPVVAKYGRTRGSVWSGGIAATFIVVLVVAISVSKHLPLARLLVSGPQSLVHLLRVAPSGLRQEHVDELKALEHRGNEFHLRGPVESATVNPGLFLMSPGLRSRPTIASYAAVTPVLCDVNRRFLEGAERPSEVLFAPSAIDGNFPTLTDGTALLSLMTHYRMREKHAAGIVFERRESTLRLTMVSRTHRTIRFGETLELGGELEGPLWLSIRFQPTLLGLLIANGFKATPVFLTIGVEGRTIQKKIPTDLAARGMLASPYLETLDDFAAFFADPVALDRRTRVTELKLERGSVPLLPDAPWFHDRIEIDVQSIELDSMERHP
jgi:hypothetical protein